MADTQLSLYRQKSFPARIAQLPVVITPPGPESTVGGTLPAYYAYLDSGMYSKYTLRQFFSDVAGFATFAREKKVKELTIYDIQQWVSTLKANRIRHGLLPYAVKTINRKLSAINNYFLWLTTEGAIVVNPAASLHVQKVLSPLPDILFEDEWKRLRTASRGDPRAYLLVLLLLETGIKKEELLALRMTHIDMSDTYAPVLSVKHTGKKIKKDRTLKLPAEFVPVYEDYQRTYGMTDVLFPYTPRFIERLLRDLALRAGVQKKVTASILRDTCAVCWLKRGEDIDLVLKKLGLSESTWEDAKKKYERLASPAL